jgi:lipoprotein-anchoring transpeptidase ErfK/SrfK
MRTAGAIAGWLVLLPAGVPQAESTPPSIARSQPLVAVYGAHLVRHRPGVRSRVVTVLRSTRPITAARTTLPVLARFTDSAHRTWLHVRLPGRVLSARAPPPAGWIRARHTLRASTPWHIVVDRAHRSVSVYRAGRRVRRYAAIVGKPSTPTPRGEFFVEENIQLFGGQPGAPYALATSARSSVLQEFEGGPGQIALHGLGGVGGQLGTAVSHGCVRLGTRAISWLAARIAPGVPVTIR